MYTLKKQKEFYKLIEQKKKEIQRLDISEDIKNNLYNLVDETIQRHEQNKIIYLNKQIVSAQLEEEEKKLIKRLENMETTIKITQFNLENILEISSHPKYKKKRILH